MLKGWIRNSVLLKGILMEMCSGICKIVIEVIIFGVNVCQTGCHKFVAHLKDFSGNGFRFGKVFRNVKVCQFRVNYSFISRVRYFHKSSIIVFMVIGFWDSKKCQFQVFSIQGIFMLISCQKC